MYRREGGNYARGGRNPPATFTGPSREARNARDRGEVLNRPEPRLSRIRELQPKGPGAWTRLSSPPGPAEGHARNECETSVQDECLDRGAGREHPLSSPSFLAVTGTPLGAPKGFIESPDIESARGSCRSPGSNASSRDPF